MSRVTSRIGERRRSPVALAALLCLLGGMGAARAWADDVQFNAQVDRAQIGLDETVSLKFNVQASGNASAGRPSFDAPDFEVINSYDSTYVESYYDQSTGKFGMKNNQSLTKVLKPLRAGNLRISHIRVTVNGQVMTSPDIVVQVSQAGAGTPPPRYYGGGGVGLRGANKHASRGQVFVRAEVDKEKVYKGEQIIVSYYLYRRVRVMNIQVDKFPELKGFLKEELEMPLTQPPFTSEPVVLDGVPYQRSLLARYAAYPLQEGKLKIDSMGLKYTYFADPGLSDDNEDPFLNFFKQLAPRESNSSSEALTIDVESLPAAGKPASFTGAVGDFSVTSAVDKYEVPANEPITLTVKIEGRGNVEAIGEPKVKWPSGWELYDSKGTAKSGKGGVGEKIFEILLIPRTPGQATLPPMEFSFFDAVKEQYVVRTTDPIQIRVGPPTPGSQGPVARSSGASSGVGDTADNVVPQQEQVRPLKLPLPVVSGATDFPLWRIMYYLACAALLIFGGLVGKDLLAKAYGKSQRVRAERSRAQERSWERLRKLAKEALNGLAWNQVSTAYETLNTLVLDALDQRYGIGARSLPRADMREILIQNHGFDEAAWRKIDRLLEYTEMIRFGGSAGLAFQDQARAELGRWISDAEAVIRKLDESKAV